jgi:CRP-like cAMP-binding protein
VHDIAEFLRRHEPYGVLDEVAVEEIARGTEFEYFQAQALVFEQGASPQHHIRMIRRGAVELLDGEQVLDELSEGELFGHPSMLTGLPTGFAARTSEDTLCYRILAADIKPLLIRPAEMRYLSREIRHREALRSRTTPVVAGRVPARPVASLLARRCGQPGVHLAAGRAARPLRVHQIHNDRKLPSPLYTPDSADCAVCRDFVSVRQRAWTLVTPRSFHGKEGVDGSSPSEGFRNTCKWPVFDVGSSPSASYLATHRDVGRGRRFESIKGRRTDRLTSKPSSGRGTTVASPGITRSA